MKKNLLIILMVFCASLLNAQVLTEDFSKCTSNSHATPGTTDIAPSFDTYTLTAGWTGSKVYQAGGEVKLGSSSVAGFIVTPAVNLAGGNFTFKFDVSTYGTDATVLQVFHASDGSTFTQVGDDFMPGASFETYSFLITGGTANSKIKISAKNAANNRYYLDNISVYTYVAPTKLAVSIKPGKPMKNVAFSVVVKALDNTNAIQPVASGTLVTLSKGNGTGTLGGTLTGSFNNSGSVIISGATYDKGESGVSISADAANLTTGVTTVDVLRTFIYTDFSTNLGGWTPVSVLGDQIWAQATFSGVTYAQMTGYVNPNYFANEDWLISPAMDFTSSGGINYLSFKNVKNYGSTAVNPLKVMISKDYTSGAPTTGTWEDITSSCTLSPGSTFVFYESGYVTLPSTYNTGVAVKVAFVYTCTTTSTEVTTIQLDDIVVGTPSEGGTSSIASIKNSSTFAIYPNPSSSVININNDSRISKVVISNMVGQTVKMMDNINNNTLEMNIEDLQNGMYNVTIQNEKGVSSQKFMKY